MKTEKEPTRRKVTLPVCSLIIQKLEETSCHPPGVHTHPAELTPSSNNALCRAALRRCLRKSFLGFSPLSSELLACVVKTQAIKYYEKSGSYTTEKQPHRPQIRLQMTVL